MNTTLRFGALLLALTPSLAQAHAVLTSDEATAGRAFKATVGIGHGCDGAATDTLAIQLPPGFLAAHPMPKPGWQVEVREGDFEQTHKLYGEDVRRGPVEIRWTGGSLDDRFYDEFTVRGTFDAQAAGQTLPFKVRQGCGAQSVAWTEVAAPGADAHALEHPAPTVRVVAASPTAGGGHAHHASAAPAAAGVAAEGGYARAMLPGAKVGGGYLTLTNPAAEPDRLVSAASPRAGKVTIHESSMENGVMRMREATAGLPVPAGGTLMLEPSGAHLMFENVAQPFREGESVPVTLRFERGGEVETMLSVGAPNAAGAPDPHAGHGN
ncbi:copper chaperone PCu(A)C [Aureimonas sp. AU4]|uniref:copper chaperone PCu(A)C n=1 Tax=Aureimonas sp. AU4 TaxID=1638163 RepID=UPI000782B510|nr:copper chaperone PCu(A)C [Aureimonas sp. AU4]